MAIYHLSVKIIGKSSGSSAVGKSAYRAGECLTNERTGLTHDFTRKRGIVHSEILLPPQAPVEYQDRQILWNAVEKIEKNSNAQFAREIEFALPKEFTEQQCKDVAREFLQSFVDEGMCVDWAFHNKELLNPNPHIHAMLTTRPIKDDGTWDAKERKEYALDENGNRIPIIDEFTGEQKIGARGRKMWKRVKVQTCDWSNRDNVEIWRQRWADTCNKYLSLENQIDHRSYERQGIDKIPTIHEGYAAKQIENKGGLSERREYNREVKHRNQLLENMKESVDKILKWTEERWEYIYDRFNQIRKNVSRYLQRSGRNVRFTGNAAGRDRELAGIEQEIKRREPEIADVTKKISIKGSERDERIRRLMERRRASGTDGTAAGPDREFDTRKQAFEGTNGISNPGNEQSLEHVRKRGIRH